MHQHYNDILSRIADAPLWFDERGVPRYCEFAPNKLNNIYLRECALMEIACQQCRQKFIVGITLPIAKSWSATLADPLDGASLADLIRRDLIHYGDPPNIRCCGAGPTMNSNPIRVIEYWHRPIQTRPGTGIIIPDTMAWRRDASLEIEIHRKVER